MTPSTTVSTSPAGVPAASAAPAAATQPGGPAAAAPAVDAAALQRQIDDLKAQSAENQRAAEFWHGKATASEKPAPAAADEAEPDLLEVIASKGSKGLDEILAKRGFVRQVDVDAAINNRTAQLTTEQKLEKQYPDLGDTQSDFFKAAAGHYGVLLKRGVAPDVAMQMAAEKTDLEFLRAGKTQLPPSKEQKEADRLARVRAQSGDPGGRTTAGAEGDDELSDEQKQIAIRLLAGDGVTPEQAIEKYKARAKKGVAIRGIGGLRQAA